MSIQKEIVVRYRVTGHVRFDLPSSLCRPKVARLLVSELNQLSGVRDATLYIQRAKLAIHFNESGYSFQKLAQRLHEIVNQVQQHPDFSDIPGTAHVGLGTKMKQSRSVMWAREKYTEARETAKAMKIVAKMGLKKPSALVKDPEKAITGFLNDILVLYLVKRYWSVITTEWLPHPLRYRYEWLSTFYLFYLLVRSRMPKK